VLGESGYRSEEDAMQAFGQQPTGGRPGAAPQGPARPVAPVVRPAAQMNHPSYAGRPPVAAQSARPVPPAPPAPGPAAERSGWRPRRLLVLLVPLVLLLVPAFISGLGDSMGTAAPPAAGPLPATTAAAQPAPDDTAGVSGGLLPRADGVQAAGKDSPQATAATPPPAPDEPQSGTLTLVLSAVMLLLALPLTFVAVTTTWWMLTAWRTPDALKGTGFTRRNAFRTHTFSLLLPARHEQEVLGDTIDALARQDHDAFEIIVIIGHDDPETLAVAHAAARRHPSLVQVVIDYNVPKNKPKGLNTALPRCRGEIIGVFDAEDEVHPGLLKLVEARFEETGASVVQSGVQLMNVHTTWWSMRNCLEYYFWFRSRLHFHSRQKFIPLGGNTVFARAEVLREFNGWDQECLAEDCELGVRLSSAGHQVAVAYDPEVVTREETPDTIKSWVKQRTRWCQGFLQVLRKGLWKELPTRRQRLLARYTLWMPFLQAYSGVMIPISVASMVLVKVPLPVTLLSFVPLVPTIVCMAVEAAGLEEFGRSFKVKIRAWDYVRLILGAFPYQVLLSVASIRAVVREARGQVGWEKTEHAGVHRQNAARSAA
jgi:cellulose synthase/poly-beta-1,6-N-acetylglucosamine synthase-like glycosyltransferase